MNEELSMLSLKFRDNLLKETNAFSIEISDKNDLAGLPENIIKSAKR